MKLYHTIAVFGALCLGFSAEASLSAEFAADGQQHVEVAANGQQHVFNPSHLTGTWTNPRRTLTFQSDGSYQYSGYSHHHKASTGEEVMCIYTNTGDVSSLKPIESYSKFFSKYIGRATHVLELWWRGNVPNEGNAPECPKWLGDPDYDLMFLRIDSDTQITNVESQLTFTKQ